MNKSTRIVKRLIALFLVVFMSINTFAAIVGDNDGAAFITKAEFDSMKTDFQSQLDRYNSSIDNKIDGEIAAYLAGVRIGGTEQKTVSYFTTFENNTEYIYMRGYYDMPFVRGYPDFMQSHMECSDYIAQGVIWGHSGDYKLAYSGAGGGQRVFVDLIGDKYFFAGYGASVKESIVITSTINFMQGDTWSGNGVYPPGTDVLVNDDVSQGDWMTDGWLSKISNPEMKGYVPNGWQSKAVALSARYANVEYQFMHDLMYDDYPVSLQNHNNVKFFERNNINDYWFAGSACTYLQMFNASNLSAEQARFERSSLNVDTTFVKCTGAPRTDMRTKAGRPVSDFRNMNVLSQGFEPDLLKWGDIYVNDSTTFEDGTQYYKMTAGMPVVYAQKDKKYKWTITMNTPSTSCYVWLKKGPFNGAPNDDECITLSNGEKKFQITNGVGVIEWEMNDGDGVVFAKWSKNFGIKNETNTLVITDKH